MRCPSVRRLIDDHVDGLLPAQEAEQVRDHLDDCRDCRETALAAKAASTSLAAWGDLEPPVHCLDAIWTKIDALPPDALDRPARARSQETSWGRLLRFGVPVAAAAAVVAGFVLVDRSGSGTPPGRATRPPVAAATLVPKTSGVAPAPGHLLPGEVYLQRDTDIESGVRRNGGVPAITVSDFRFRTPR